MKDIKLKFKQFFCKHKEKAWYIEKKQGLVAISGEKRYLLCENCRKQLDTHFARYEGNGFK